MNIADDLARAYDDGYAQGKAETEAYLLHCGDVTPVTNADRIRAMTDEELAEWFKYDCPTASLVKECSYTDKSADDCRRCWLNWLKQEIDNG